MKRYKSLFERKVTTIEFFVRGGKIYIIHNNETYDLMTFWKDKENNDLLFSLYKKLEKEYTNLFHNLLLTLKSSRDWKNILINFINLHFNKLDKIYDVLIGPNFTVDFNLER